MKLFETHISLVIVLLLAMNVEIQSQVEIPASVVQLAEERVGEDLWKDIHCIHVRTSLTGEHYTCAQYIEGTRVYGSYLKFHVFNEDIVEWSSHLAKGIKRDYSFPELNDEPITVIRDNDSIAKQEEVWFRVEDGIVPALLLTVVGGYDRAMEYVMDNQFNVLDSLDHVCYFDLPEDTTANAMVFLPDPLTSSGNDYGGLYIDAGDMNLAVLNAERIAVKIPVTFDTGYFHLENDYVLITNHNNPNYLPAKVTNGNFDFDRSDQGFEDVNVFYHLNVYQEHLQNLGFTNLVNYQIHAETHASQNDNSTFVSTHSPPRLSFGEGGVDDGEDADVIIHEYGHAISFSAAPGSNSGMERRSLDEGLGDYLAASYSRNINPFRWDDVFTWDGHNEFFSGRSASSDKKYPQDLSGSDIHANGEIWSSALMELWDDIGGDITDRILIESLYNYYSGMDMNDAARLFVLADSLLYNGIHYNSICDVFNDRGFSTSCNNYNSIDEISDENGLIVRNSLKFSQGGRVVIESKGKTMSYMTLFNSMGQEMDHYLVNATLYGISSQNLSSGLYFLNVLFSDNSQKTIRLVRK